MSNFNCTGSTFFFVALFYILLSEGKAEYISLDLNEFVIIYEKADMIS